MSIYYNSSKIASILGYNYYTNLEEYVDLFVSYLYKNAEELKTLDEDIVFKTCEQDMKEKILKSDIEEISKKQILKIYDESSKINNLIQLKDNTDTVERILNDQSTKLSDDIMPIVKTKLNCSFGKNTENTAIKLFKDLTNLEIVENNTKLLKIKFDDFYICGKIDGLLQKEEEEYVVEIKNRKNKFFDKIPKYELIQIILYTKLCNNNNVCFIQKLGEELKIEYFKDIDPNSTIFNELIDRLTKLNSFILSLREDNNERKKMMKMSKIRMYIYIKNALTFLPYKKM